MSGPGVQVCCRFGVDWNVHLICDCEWSQCLYGKVRDGSQGPVLKPCFCEVSLRRASGTTRHPARLSTAATVKQHLYTLSWYSLYTQSSSSSSRVDTSIYSRTSVVMAVKSERDTLDAEQVASSCREVFSTSEDNTGDF